MSSVLIPGTVEAEILMAIDGENVENTLYFEKAGAWSVAEATSLATALNNWWIAYYKISVAAALTFLGTKVTDWTSLTGVQVFVPVATAQAGSQPHEMMPANCAPAITFHTAQRGRSHRGRNYIVGIDDTQVTQNRFLGAWATAMETCYNALLGVADAEGCTWVVASRYSGTALVDGKKKAVPRAVGITTPVTSASFKDYVIDSQRSRLPNH